MGAPSGALNYKWRGGKHVTQKNYIRLSCKPHRNKYEHRVVIEHLIASGTGGLIWINQTEIPDSMTVHHNDHVRSHNCLGNLMLLDKAIHDYLSSGDAKRKAENELYGVVPF